MLRQVDHLSRAVLRRRSEESAAEMHPTAGLPRAWWFPPLRGLRPDAQATYARYPLNDQPSVAARADGFAWLECEPEKPQWAISRGDQAHRPLSPENLVALAGELPVPESLRTFAARSGLQSRIRSATACYLDLGDAAAPTTVDGGFLIHLLSDQQIVRHWLLYVDAEGNESVVTSPRPIGLDLPDDWPDRPPAVIALDGSVDIEVCADTFAEFVYRFWLENELWYALHEGGRVPEHLAWYAAGLRAAHP